MSYHHIKNPRIKLLSFSPDEKFNPTLKQPKSNNLTSTQLKLYQIYHQNKNKHDQKFGRSDKSSMSNSRVINPEEIDKFIVKKKVNNVNNKNLSNEGSKRINSNTKIRASSTNAISNEKKHQPQIIKKTTESPSIYNLYLTQKNSYKHFSQSRIQNEKDITLLTRTLYSSRKEEQNIKKKLVKMLGKTIQLQEKQREKQQIRKRHNDWLQKQKNQNNTKKYMNYLMKYQAKKSLLQTNMLAAQQIRQRSQSASYIRSLRSTISSRQKLQRSRLMKQLIKQNIHKAQQKNTNKIRQKSNSVKQRMIKGYECEANMESWRIGQLDKKAKRLALTIENSRRNKQLLRNVVDSVGKKKASKYIINQLNKTLHTMRTQNIQ